MSLCENARPSCGSRRGVFLPIRRGGGIAEVTLPQRGRVSRLTLEPLPSAPSLARRLAAEAMCEWGIPAEIAESARLVVSELVTNACNASAALPPLSVDSEDLYGCGLISLTLRLVPGRLVIEVSDDSPKPPVITDADPDSECGRGLMLVEALTREWGHLRLPAGGKVVFCVLGVPVFAGQSASSPPRFTAGRNGTCDG